MSGPPADHTPTPAPPKKRRKPHRHKETLVNSFIELLKVRSIITFAVIGVMSYLAVIEAIEPATFMTVASAVITYYFTRKENGEK
jgi:hypothetical protein